MAEFTLTPSQDRAVHCIDKNVAVSAGAGSGKTRVLVQRILYILGRGIQRPADRVLPREILAVTFTRKAASEMRDRIRQEMETLAEGEHRAYWQQQMKDLTHAQIGTIHSFCSSLLRANPVESDLDPAFAVMEERDHTEFLVTEVRNRLRRLLKEKDPAAVQLCDEYGSSSLQQQTIALLEKGISFSEGDLTAAYEEELNALQQDVAWLRTLLTPDFPAACSSGNRQVLENCIADIQNALTDIPKPENQEYLLGIAKGLKRNGKNKEDIGAVKNALERIVSYPLCIRARLLASAWETYLLQMREFLAAKLQAAGFLSFDDLEEKALALLEQHPEVLEKCRKQFRYILVDEFQDTNERQRQLVYLLCGGNRDQLQDRRLFVVGDAKQSIYRFRGADVSVFARVRNEIVATGGELIRLDDNFRTVEPVLQLCNDLFPGIMGNDTAKDVYYEALQPHRESNSIPEFFVQHYEDGVPLEEARQQEVRWLADRLSALHREGTAWEDMAVLLQKMTHISMITEALQQRSVPYTVTDGRGFFERTEIRDLMNLFAFAVDPHDDLNLSAVLRSVYMGIDDAALTRMHIALGEYNAKKDNKVSLWEFLRSVCQPGERDGEQPKPEADDQPGEREGDQPEKQAGYQPETTEAKALARAVSLLDSLPVAAAVLNLPDFCRKIAGLLHPETVLALQDNGEEQLANLRKLFQMARDFTVQKKGSVPDFTLRLRQLAEEKDRESAATAATEGAVQLMTVHKAKGLEFPVVAVPFLDTTTPNDTSQAVWHPSLGLGISVRNDGGDLVAAPLLRTIKDTNKEKNREEKARLLYVAMTRARDRLILTGCLKATANKSKAIHWLNWLDQKLPEEYAGLVRHVSEKDTPAAGEPVPASAQAAPVSETNLAGLLAQAAPVSVTDLAGPLAQAAPISKTDLAELLAQVAPLDSAGGKTMTEFSATSLKEYALCPRRYYYGVIENIPSMEGLLPEAPLHEELVAAEQRTPQTGTQAYVMAEPSREGSTAELLPVAQQAEPSREAGTSLPADVLGTLVHRVLEKYAKWRMGHQYREDGQVWQELYARELQEVAGGRSDLAAEAEAMLQAYLQSGLYQSFASRQTFAEYKFRLPLLQDDCFTYTVTGVIDAIAEREDGQLEIIDYKSGKPPGTMPGEAGMPSGYAWQLALYKMALEHLLRLRGKPSVRVKKASLHYLRDLSERVLPDRDYRQEITAVCREIAEKKREEDFPCKPEHCAGCPFAYMCKI